jgi:hypothetical protein
MNDPKRPFHSDELDAKSEEVARIVIKERPEVAACLDGLVFRGQEDALLQLLRAALINMTSSVQLDLEDEDAISACIPDMKTQTERMQLAALALDWEIETRRDPQPGTRQRSAGYRAEVDELLHGPLAPLGLMNGQEQAVVVRWARKSLARESEVEDAEAETKKEELSAIIEDIDAEPAEFPRFITGVPRRCLAEWLARWGEEAFEEANDERILTQMPSDVEAEQTVPAELSLLRDIQKRLQLLTDASRGPAAQACRSIIPRNAS